MKIFEARGQSLGTFEQEGYLGVETLKVRERALHQRRFLKLRESSVLVALLESCRECPRRSLVCAGGNDCGELGFDPRGQRTDIVEQQARSGQATWKAESRKLREVANAMPVLWSRPRGPVLTPTSGPGEHP